MIRLLYWLAYRLWRPVAHELEVQRFRMDIDQYEYEEAALAVGQEWDE